MEISKNIEIRDVSYDINDIIAKAQISSGLISKIYNAQVLFVPLMEFRGDEPLFHTGTAEFYKYCVEKMNTSVEICIDDDKYYEIALCSADRRFGKFRIESVVLPLFLGVLTNYISDKITSKEKTVPQVTIVDESTNTTTTNNYFNDYLAPSTVSFTVAVQDSLSGKSKEFTYEGPASEIEGVVEQIKILWDE